MTTNNPPLMDRITDAIQRKYDIIQELRALAAEFSDSVERMQVQTSRLQAEYERTSVQNVIRMPDVKDDDFSIPAMFREGPNKQ